MHVDSRFGAGVIVILWLFSSLAFSRANGCFEMRYPKIYLIIMAGTRSPLIPFLLDTLYDGSRQYQCNPQ